MKRQLLSLALIIFLLPMQVLAANLQQKNANFQKKDQAELMAKVAGGYGEIGETRQALQILDNALKLAKPLPKDSYKDLALREICQQYVAIAHLDKAIEAANAMPQDTLKVYCLTAIAAKYRIQGNRTLADKVIDQALQTANAISVEKSNHEALRYAEEPRSLALVNVIEELIASEQIERALRLAKTIPLASYQREASRKILKAKTKQPLKPEQEKAKPIAIIPTKVCTGVPANKLLGCAFQKALLQEPSLEKHIFGQNLTFSGI
ncbi:hypothetical protein H6F43_20660, partial [Leptolyngbya sp. FACHB-36]|uniref:hypothetical protein n=1 Tax=Leptolyngbya sp. FACHB-36 TaxID=2692808 RepID=UPI0016809B58